MIQELGSREFLPLTEPSLPFPMAIGVQMIGDRIEHAEIEIGFCHQGLEKIAEDLLVWDLPELLRRVNPHFPHTFELLGWQAVHEAAQVKLDSSMAIWTEVVLDLSKLYHHMFWIKKITKAALFFPLSSALQIEEANLAALLRHLWPCRILEENVATQIQDQFNNACSQIDLLVHSMLKNRNLLKRLIGLGTISKASALSFGLTGPVFAACSWSQSANSDIIDDSTSNKCDSWDRLVTASLEILKTIEILQRTLPHITTMAAGGHAPEFAVSRSLEIKKNNDFVNIRAPNGDVWFYFICDEKGKLLRAHIRAPSFNLVSALPSCLKGTKISDAGIVLASLPIYGTEVDR